MFEKPQYMTPNGFQRNKKNPGDSTRNKMYVQQKALQIRRDLFNKNSQRTISPETAKLIALAIKGMLK